MTNTLNKIMHDGDEYLLPEWFSPDNAWNTNDVLTKTADGYEWASLPAWSSTITVTLAFPCKDCPLTTKSDCFKRRVPLSKVFKFIKRL